MAAPVAPSTPLAAGRTGTLGASAGAVVLAVSVPFMFLHVDHNPGVTLTLGSTSGKVTLADLAVLAVVVAAAATAARDGLGVLRAGLPVWIVSGALVAWIGVMTLWPALTEDQYRLGDNSITTARFAEYALLAVAVPLLVRRLRDLALLAWSFALWCAVAAAVGIVQFLGVDIFDAWPAGWRQPSFLGHHDFAALAGAALGIAVAGVVSGNTQPGTRRLVLVAGLGGGIALALSGSIAGAAGLAVGAVVAVVAAWTRFRPSGRRLVTLGAIVVVVGAGSLLLRGGDIDQFLRFTGVREKDRETVENVQTYSQRSVLLYIGGRIFLDNPVVGLGWQASGEPWGFLPYVDDARRRFPDVSEESLPADDPDREFGIQNAFMQSLADLGLIGFALFVGVFVTAVAVAWRAVRRSAEGWAQAGDGAIVALCVAAGLWAAIGLVSAQPIDAVTWLAAGVAVAAAAAARESARG